VGEEMVTTAEVDEVGRFSFELREERSRKDVVERFIIEYEIEVLVGTALMEMLSRCFLKLIAVARTSLKEVMVEKRKTTRRIYMPFKLESNKNWDLIEVPIRGFCGVSVR
jgi:hypothetical protein